MNKRQIIKQQIKTVDTDESSTYFERTDDASLTFLRRAFHKTGCSDIFMEIMPTCDCATTSEVPGEVSFDGIFIYDHTRATAKSSNIP